MTVRSLHETKAFSFAQATYTVLLKRASESSISMLSLLRLNRVFKYQQSVSDRFRALSLILVNAQKASN